MSTPPSSTSARETTTRHATGSAAIEEGDFEARLGELLTQSFPGGAWLDSYVACTRAVRGTKSASSCSNTEGKLVHYRTLSGSPSASLLTPDLFLRREIVLPLACSRAGRPS